MIRCFTTIALGTLAACTGGGMPTSAGNSAGVTVDINFDAQRPGKHAVR